MEEYSFAGQKKDEKVVLITKQHPWVMTKPFLWVVLILTITILAIKMALTYSDTMMITYIIATIGLLEMLNVGGKNYYIWQNSLFVLTNERIIIVDQNGWFNRNVSEANLENILFINHNIKGFIRSMMNFGDLNIRASGVAEDELIFYDVSDPYNIQQEIVKSQSELKSHREIKMGEGRQEKLDNKPTKVENKESQDFWHNMSEKKVIR